MSAVSVEALPELESEQVAQARRNKRNVALGVFVGASVGSRVSHRIDVRVLRWLFVVVLVYTAIQMATRALGL